MAAPHPLPVPSSLPSYVNSKDVIVYSARCAARNAPMIWPQFDDHCRPQKRLPSHRARLLSIGRGGV
jgi:hypothetical protein